jgi:hypothetical protein
MNHAKTSFSTEILTGAIISVVQYLAPLRYCTAAGGYELHWSSTYLYNGIQQTVHFKGVLSNAPTILEPFGAMPSKATASAAGVEGLGVRGEHVIRDMIACHLTTNKQNVSSILMR